MSLKRIQKAQNEKSNGKFLMSHSVKSLQNGVPFSERLRCEWSDHDSTKRTD